MLLLLLFVVVVVCELSASTGEGEAGVLVVVIMGAVTGTCVESLRLGGGVGTLDFLLPASFAPDLGLTDSLCKS
jgi:hypothetical protein